MSKNYKYQLLNNESINTSEKSDIDLKDPEFHYFCSYCWDMDCKHFTIAVKSEIKTEGSFFNKIKKTYYNITIQSNIGEKIKKSFTMDEDNKHRVIWNVGRAVRICIESLDQSKALNERNRLDFPTSKGLVPRKYCTRCKGSGKGNQCSQNIKPCTNCSGMCGIKCTYCLGHGFNFTNDNMKHKVKCEYCNNGFTIICFKCKGAGAELNSKTLDTVPCNHCYIPI
jgi:hypothetical protein